VATHRTDSRRMIHLASDGVAVRIDPRHGGEVLDLIDLRTGRQLLGPIGARRRRSSAGRATTCTSSGGSI